MDKSLVLFENNKFKKLFEKKKNFLFLKVKCMMSLKVEF